VVLHVQSFISMEHCYIAQYLCASSNNWSGGLAGGVLAGVLAGGLAGENDLPGCPRMFLI
jgi:hypothetical protein